MKIDCRLDFGRSTMFLGVQGKHNYVLRRVHLSSALSKKMKPKCLCRLIRNLHVKAMQKANTAYTWPLHHIFNSIGNKRDKTITKIIVNIVLFVFLWRQLYRFYSLRFNLLFYLGLC